MRLPRDLDGETLALALLQQGFERARQAGSHIQMRHIASGETITVPAHSPLKVGTLSAIVRDLVAILDSDREAVLIFLSKL